MSKKCTHHWIIEEPDGAISNAICKLCKATKEFSNTVRFRSQWSNQSGKIPSTLRRK